MNGDDTRDPNAPPSAEELTEAEALRDALEAPPGGPRHNAAADFARAASLAHAPGAIREDQHRALIERAIARGEARRATSRRRQGRATIALASGLALAAAVALTVGRFSREASRAPAAASIEPLVPVRSTQPLFREPFARSGGESARIDRIASARAADLRDNRFAAWGIK